MNNSYQPEYDYNIKRLRLKGKGYFGHYAFVLLPLIPAFMSFFNYIQFLNGTSEGVITKYDLFKDAGIFTIIALVLLLLQFNRLKFKIIETNISTEAVLDLCRKFARINNLELRFQSQNEFVAVSNGFLSFGTWGEMLTVIIQDKKVYINSICDPYKRPNLISMGKNKAYKRALIKTINNASA